MNDDEMLSQYEMFNNSKKSNDYMEEALKIGRKMNYIQQELLDDNFNQQRNDDHEDRHSIRAVNEGDYDNLTKWATQIERENLLSDNNVTTMSEQSFKFQSNDVINIDHIMAEDNHLSISNVICGLTETEKNSSPSYSNEFAARLNRKQNMAFNIVINKLKDEENGIFDNKLLLNIQGGPGTGKSEVIKAISKHFELTGNSNQLARASQTGIAASSIDGETLHALTKIPVNGGDPSRKSLYKLATRLKFTRFLIIDEISMVSKQFFNRIERAFSMARDLVKDESDSVHDGIFGGLNVIIVGDFHQFGPVATGKCSSLFSTKNSLINSSPKKRMEMQAGFQLYRQFADVILLDEQMRVEDPVWMDIIEHARFGKCNQDHLNTLRTLIIDKQPSSDLNSSTFTDNSNAILVTPRHIVRRAWNKEALIKHCQKTGNPRVTIMAKDTIKGRGLTVKEKVAAIKSKRAKNGINRFKPEDDEMERQGLSDRLDLATGAEVMVTANIDTKHGIANGARGQITAIVLNAEEDIGNASQSNNIKLRYMPSYIIVKFYHQTKIHFDNLKENEYPIQTIQKSYRICLDDKTKSTVYRQQIPLTLGYSFTDYRVQGQTISNLIVDIAKPPTGSISQYNAYVALSRIKGREGIRLLRDFEDELLQTSIDPELIDENSRLKKLASFTEMVYNTQRIS
jgi:hypothetical protein